MICILIKIFFLNKIKLFNNKMKMQFKWVCLFIYSIFYNIQNGKMVQCRNINNFFKSFEIF